MQPEIEQLIRDSRASEQGGDIAVAYERAEQAYQAALRLEQEPDAVSALLRLSEINLRMGQFALAAERAGEVQERTSKPVERIYALIHRGVATAQTSEFKLAEDYLLQAAAIARETGNQNGLARALHNLAAAVYLPRGQFDLALSAIAESSSLVSLTGGENWDLLFLKGFIYMKTGDRNRARLTLDDMMTHVVPASRVAGAYYLLWAQLSMDEDDLARAREYLNLGMQVATRLGDFDQSIWVRLANCLYNRMQNNPSGALNWAEDALSFAQRAGSRYFAAQALIERGQAAWMAGDVSGAEQDIQAAVEITRQMDCRYHLARAYLLLSAIHQAQELPQAEDEWLQTVNLIKRGGYGYILERERSLAFPMVAGFLKSRSKETRAAAEAMIDHLEQIAPLPLRVVGLGSFTVWQGRRQIPDKLWSKRKAGELFRYLVLQPNRTAPREVVLENLWGEHNPSTAQDLFHQATSNLRHTLEPDLPDKFASRYLTVESERVILYLPPGSAVDFDQFTKQVPQAIHSGNMEQLQRALSYYPGDLFPQDMFADWATGPREYVQQIFINGLLALGEGYLRSNQYLQALDACQRILQRNAWNEDAVLVGMRACLGLRDIPRAVKLYMDLEKILHTELQIAPRTDLRELVKTLRAQK